MDRRFASTDYFAVLGLVPAAGDAEVRAAFRRLALVHHPDKATYGKEAATRHFQEIAEAYEVLSDAELRALRAGAAAAKRPRRGAGAPGHGRRHAQGGEEG